MLKIRSKLNNEGWYSLKQLNKLDCDWNMIIGGRTNGKSDSVLRKMLDKYIENGNISYYIRRYKTSIKDNKFKRLFDDILNRDNSYYRKKLKCDDLKLKGLDWYRIWYTDDNKILWDDYPIIICASLSTWENDKGSLPDLNPNIIFFDEFISRDGYLIDEFVILCNTISTLKRGGDKVKIYLVGNTVTWSCPYFREFGIYNIQDLDQGTIYQYEYNMTDKTGRKMSTTLALEYSLDSTNDKKKLGDRFFSFNNPRLSMITDGEWELANYPHLTYDMYTDDSMRIVSRDIYMIDSPYIICLEIRKSDIIGTYIYVRPYTKDITDIDKRAEVIYYPDDFIFDKRYCQTFRDREIDRLINKKCKEKLIFFMDNTCGENFRNCVKKLLENSKNFL